eukprot:6196097-Pleurochrysis_carterae.AAC.2
MRILDLASRNCRGLRRRPECGEKSKLVVSNTWRSSCFSKLGEAAVDIFCLWAERARPSR